MDTREAYNQWSTQYDTNENKTRDVEAVALRTTLNGLNFENCLEIGCGTGKNTQYLASKASQITSVDFSENMLEKAKEKSNPNQVRFLQADITLPWEFGEAAYDLVVFSLVLEHVSNLDPVFYQANNALKQGGYVYIGELHPFKQYAGTKARFETNEGLQTLLCFTHHVSDYTRAAKNFGLGIVSLEEYFDDDCSSTPRILTILLRKL